jgi:hypothetical protein
VTQRLSHANCQHQGEYCERDESEQEIHCFYSSL